MPRPLIALATAMALLLVGSTSAAATVVYDGSPTTAAAPADLGPYTMLAFGPESRPEFANVTMVAGPLGDATFTPAVGIGKVPSSWSNWSHGFTGTVYVTDLSTQLIVLPPGTGAFDFYLEPDDLGTYDVTAVGDGTSSGPVSVTGDAGARYFGFYATPGSSLDAIAITADGAAGGFAIGELRTAAARSAGGMRRPFVTDVSPDSGTTRGGETITVRGENFSDGSGVLFGATPASSVRIVNHTTLRVETPAHAPGGYDVTVVNRHGTSPQVDAAAYTFVARR